MCTHLAQLKTDVGGNTASSQHSETEEDISWEGLLTLWTNSFKSTQKWSWRRKVGLLPEDCSTYIPQSLKEMQWMPWVSVVGWVGGGVGVACVWWCTEEQMPVVTLFPLVLWTHTAPQSEHGQERINTGTHTHNLSPRLSRRLLAAQRPQFIFCLTPK